MNTSVGDLTAVLAATMREHKLQITRPDIDHIVQATFAEASTRNENMISLEEWVAYDCSYLPMIVPIVVAYDSCLWL